VSKILSCACNEEGLSQVVPVLQRAGYKEIPIANCATIYEDYKAGGDFHIDMIFGPLDLRVALIYPSFLDYQNKFYFDKVSRKMI
jgi:N-dimethylarginine dimethylaminohydrolase